MIEFSINHEWNTKKFSNQAQAFAYLSSIQDGFATVSIKRAGMHISPGIVKIEKGVVKNIYNDMNLSDLFN